MSNDHENLEIRLILGDQLNTQHPWFEEASPSVLFVMMEIRPESEYVKHHIQKIAGIFAAMRKFASQLEEKGHRVQYYQITDKDNLHDFEKNLKALSEQQKATSIRIQEPDEWRLDQLLRIALKSIDLPHFVDSSHHFYTSRDELQRFFKGKRQYLMESFYREMRRKHHVLMDSAGQPVSGKWNFDKENRKPWPKDHQPPTPLGFNHNVSDIVSEIDRAGLAHFGEIDAENYPWPLCRDEAIELLQCFLDELLPVFGKYQDALSDNHWSLYHSRLSFALNTKMIGPAEVVNAVEEHWQANKKKISLAQAEGFIRQILGWREYMRGIYWAHMPDYAEKNFFDHDRPLPEYFWTGKTKMRCVSKAIGQSLEKAYAHHIQRLMVTGNFALLAGIHPDAVDAWYLGIYIDAFEWVEITNTRGMSQFADGGIVGTKPYVSSASYINKMSDHCAHCSYDPKKSTGENACPFNSLYWNFLHRHREKLGSNRRMSLMYNVWDKFSDEKQRRLRTQAETYLENIQNL